MELMTVISNLFIL